MARRLAARMAEAVHTSRAVTSGSAGKPKALVIAGTTAVGKTDLSLELAWRLNGEVISADSVQVYKHMDIGSAKAGPEVTADTPHHLLDVATITEPFSVLHYYRLACRAMEDIVARGRVPLLVGGTGMYVSTVMDGPTGSPPSTSESRAMVDAVVEQDEGRWEDSLARLKALDPVYAASLFPNDWYRLKRGLEICMLSGQTVTSYKRTDEKREASYDFKCLFLSMPRIALFQRIDHRCEVIVEQGLLTEVISLVRAHGLVLESQAGRSVGYRQALVYLRDVWGFPSAEAEGKGYSPQIPPEEMRKSFYEFLSTYKVTTRNLARRQLVLLRKDPRFLWINMAPAVGGQQRNLATLADAVTQWFTDGSPLPAEWDGNTLKELSAEEKGVLKEYSTHYGDPILFSDVSKVDSILQTVEAALKRT